MIKIASILLLIGIFLFGCTVKEKEENKKGTTTKVKVIQDKEIINIAKELNYGNNFFQEKESAKNALEKLEKMKDSFYKYYYKGYAYEISKEYNKAIENYKRSIDYTETKAQKVSVLNQIGHVYDLMGDTETANKFYQKAEKINDSFLGALINRGRYEYRKGNLEKAEGYFKKTLKLAEDSFIKAEIYFNLSSIYQIKGDTQKAIEYAEKGIKAEKSYPYNYLSLGRIYVFDSKNIDKAKEYLEKTLSLYPKSSLAAKYLGIYYYIKDDYDNAIKYFKLQLENTDKDILLMDNERVNIKNEALYDLARTYALKKDIQNSINYLEKVLNGKNINIYYSFLNDISIKNGPFSKIEESKEFKNSVYKILKLYNIKK